MTRIIVVVRNGLVESVYTDSSNPVEVEVLDYDYDGGLSEEEERKLEKHFKNLEKTIESWNCIY